MYNRPLHHELFLELLRSALWNRVPNSVLFGNLDESIWEKVMATAQKQALLGVCYPVLNLMPLDFRPPPKIYLLWAAKANYICQDNKKKLRILSELLTLLESHDIHPVVMKGFSSAIFYPEPDLRICGDIDLYVPEKYIETVEFIKKLGYEIISTSIHHKFYFNGVLIELHHQIISPPFKKIHNYKVLDVEYSGVKFRIFDETTTAILLLTHTIRHLIGPGIGFRHVCDWIMFNSRNNINNSQLSEYIADNKLLHFVYLLNGIIINLKLIREDYLGTLGMISEKKNNHKLIFIEKDLFKQGDCGRNEIMFRWNKPRMIYFFRVLNRYLKFFVYCPIIVLKIIFSKLLKNNENSNT